MKTKQVQEIVLTNPMGISRLMDLLADAREIIRNEVCVCARSYVNMAPLIFGFKLI